MAAYDRGDLPYRRLAAETPELYARGLEGVAQAELEAHARSRRARVLTTWPPRGPVFAAVSLMRQAIARVRPPEGSPPVNWRDPSMLEDLLGPYGELEVREQQLAHEKRAPEEVWERWERLHPMWIGPRSVLEPAGEWKQLREASVSALREGAMDAGTTSPYLLAILDRR